MIEQYKVITFTHHQVDVANLGKYQVVIPNEGELYNILHGIKKSMKIEEIIYLSTCNRVSYIFYTKEEITPAFIGKMIRMANNQIDNETIENLDDDVSLYEGIEAIQHVFEVAGSVDSLVVGESEIFHQFRTAYEQASSNNLVGDNLRLLEKITVQVAKRIYSHTRINEKPLSIAALAGQAIMESDCAVDNKIVLIGSGETNTLVAKFLYKHHFKNIHIYNRSIENAKKLADIVDGKFYALEELYQLTEFDIIIACTSMQQHIVTHNLYERIIGTNEDRKYLIDLAVPANIDPAINDDFNAKYISIDDLKSLADKNLHFRKQEISIAKTIIEQALKDYEKAYAQRQIELALADLPGEIKKVKDKITDSVFKEKIETLNPEQKEILQEILDYMEAKCVGIPMKLAKGTVK